MFRCKDSPSFRKNFWEARCLPQNMILTNFRKNGPVKSCSGGAEKFVKTRVEKHSKWPTPIYCAQQRLLVSCVVWKFRLLFRFFLSRLLQKQTHQKRILLQPSRIAVDCLTFWTSINLFEDCLEGLAIILKQTSLRRFTIFWYEIVRQ